MSVENKAQDAGLSDEKKQEEKAKKEEKAIRISRIIGCIIFFTAIALLTMYLFNQDEGHKNFRNTGIILAVIGVLFILPINYYLFDVEDWEENDSIRAVIKKLRLRAILFNNLSILILLIAIAVIVFSFYQLSHPSWKPAASTSTDTNASILFLATQVGSAVILIFLVQILFRVFKYLIRVGGFYNGKADALELNFVNNNNKYDADKLLESMTPQSYDISDIESPNLFPGK